MTTTTALTCDGCGQAADEEHFARRLRRLEWATRYRPVHIQALILGGVAPKLDAEFLYAGGTEFQGEARNILRATQVSIEGKSHEAVLTEFQKLGLMLTHVLECPLNADGSPEQTRGLLERQVPTTLARIRRSLRPKRVVLFSEELGQVVDAIRSADLGCQVWPEAGRPFFSAGALGEDEEEFRRAVRGG